MHSDLCQMDAPSLGGAKYFMTLLDDFSKRIHIYLLKTKDGVQKCISHFITQMDSQYGLRIKVLRTDNGKEYINQQVERILEQSGITHQTSIAYNPQQNGRAERINRTLLDKVRFMLIESGMQKKFWGEAIVTAAYIHNRSPKKSLDHKTPEEIWTGTKPDLSNLRMFGCKADMYVPEQKRSKMDLKMKECFMLGYCLNQKGYRLWEPTRQQVLTARDVVFFERVLPQASDVVFLPIEGTTSSTLPSSNITKPASDPDIHPQLQLEQDNMEQDHTQASQVKQIQK